MLSADMSRAKDLETLPAVGYFCRTSGSKVWLWAKENQKMERRMDDRKRDLESSRTRSSSEGY
jgi:hypothetical protein